MADLLTWLQQHWFPLVQTVGIIGSLWLTNLSVRAELRSRRIDQALTLAGHHRDLWSEVHRRPELSRLLVEEVDLVAEPITRAEEEFLNVVIVHFQTGWQIAKEGSVLSRDTLALDARAFFSLPLPAAVWGSTLNGRDSEFVGFIAGVMRMPRPVHGRLLQPPFSDPSEDSAKSTFSAQRQVLVTSSRRRR